MLLLALKYPKISGLTSLYSFIACSVIYYIIFELVVDCSMNISVITGILPGLSMSIMVVPQLAIPYVCTFKHFINLGFLKKSLYSGFYSANFNILMINLIESLFKSGQDMMENSSDGLLDRSYIRITIVSIFILQNLIFARICLQKGKYESKNVLLSMAVVAQDFLISLYLERILI